MAFSAVSFPQGFLPHTPSSQAKETILLTSIRSNRLVEGKEVKYLLNTHRDVIEPGWEARHAKFIYENGCAVYDQLAHRARTYGKNPRALMAFLLNKEATRDYAQTAA